MNSMSIVVGAAVEATRYEMINSEIKKAYLLKNIQVYNRIAKKIEGTKGTFGTGYPFYALGENLNGDLPVIEEQIRYNHELMEHALLSQGKDWPCATCLEKRGNVMPDLKRICKPCPNTSGELKPRKVLNRLPDMDLWVVCKEQDRSRVAEELTLEYENAGLYTSDNYPIRTIKDLKIINNSLENGNNPDVMLPLDSHIIDYETLEELIRMTPEILEQSLTTHQTPYLPIHPLSYRKTWQYDDTSYNFVHDYLSSLTEYDFDENLTKLLKETRHQIANSYCIELLYYYLLASGPNVVKERHKTLVLRKKFEEKIERWKN